MEIFSSASRVLGISSVLPTLLSFETGSPQGLAGLQLLVSSLAPKFSTTGICQQDLPYLDFKHNLSINRF